MTVKGGLSPERLDEIEALAAASSDPWEIGDTMWQHDGTFMSVNITDGPFDLIACYGGGNPSSGEREAVAEADAAFIAAAPTVVPELLAEVRRLQAADDAACQQLSLRDQTIARLS